MADKTMSGTEFIQKLIGKTQSTPIQKDNQGEYSVQLNSLEKLVYTFRIEREEKKKILDNFDSFIENKLNDFYKKTASLHDYVTTSKKYLREQIKFYVRTSIEKTKLFRTQQERIISDAFETAWDKTETAVGDILDYSQSTLKTLWDSLSKVGHFFGAMGNCLLDFVIGPFKAGWKILDGFMNQLTPETWNLLKNVASNITLTVQWLWNTGKKALEFVWDGVSTIFKVGYTIISKAAKVLYEGSKGVFMWWFKMLLNTLFNPTMWIINIPIFLGISGALFVALASVSSLLLDLASPLFKKIFDLGGNAFDWIWSGLTWFWGWIKKEYDGSWAQKLVNDYIVNNIKGLLDVPFIKNVLHYVKTAYAWIVTDGVGVINSAWEYTTQLTKYLKDESGRTTLSKFLTWATNWQPAQFIPGWKQIVSFLRGEFGSLSGVAEGTSLSDIKTQLHTIQRNRVSNIIEYESLKLVNKGVSDKDALKEINDSLLPKLRALISDAGLSSDDVDKIIQEKLSISKKILDSGGVGALKDYEKNIYNETRIAAEYQGVIDNIQKGLFDQSSPRFQKMMDQMFNSSFKQFEKERSERIEKKKFKSEVLSENIIRNIKDYKTQLEKTSNLISFAEYQKEFYDKKDQLDAVSYDWDFDKNVTKNIIHNFAITGQYFDRVALRSINNVGMITSATIGGAVGGESGFDKGMELYKSISSTETIADLQLRKAQEEFGSDTQQVLQSKIRAQREAIPHEAMGGVKKPDDLAIKPLNDMSINFVREKTKHIKKPDDIIDQSKQKNKEQSNITIIEEQTSIYESYELYTMSHIAKGTIAGG